MPPFFRGGKYLKFCCFFCHSDRLPLPLQPIKNRVAGVINKQYSFIHQPEIYQLINL